MTTESPAPRVLEDLRVELFRKGVTLSALAREVGMSTSKVSRRFNRETPITIDELSTFAGVAGARIEVTIQSASAAATAMPPVADSLSGGGPSSSSDAPGPASEDAA